MFVGGMDIRWVIVIIGVVVIVMTFFGGMEAIIWMDVIQGFLLIIGGLLAVGILFDGMLPLAAKYVSVVFWFLEK